MSISCPLNSRISLGLAWAAEHRNTSSDSWRLEIWQRSFNDLTASHETFSWRAIISSLCSKAALICFQNASCEFQLPSNQAGAASKPLSHLTVAFLDIVSLPDSIATLQVWLNMITWHVVGSNRQYFHFAHQVPDSQWSWSIMRQWDRNWDH